MPRITTVLPYLALATVACNQPCDEDPGCRDPHLYVLTPNTTPRDIDYDLERKSVASIAAGRPFNVIHILPPGVRAPGRLDIEVDTPCVREQATTHHGEDGIAVFPMVAPAGAECGLTVTTTVANSRLLHAAGPTDDCPDDLACPTPDALSTDGSPEGGTTDG